jgi:hypothetical protein
MFLYYLIFIILVFFVVLNKEGGKIGFFFSGTLLFAIAGFRPAGIDNDYAGYVTYYQDIASGLIVAVEPTFLFISSCVKYFFNNPAYLFVIYAGLGISLKFYAIDHLTKLKALTIVVYFSGFFLLHEMTQIRVGVAAGLLLLCIEPIRERNLWKFLLLASLAFLFHFSAIVIFPLYFLSPTKFNNKVYVVLIPGAYLLNFLKIDLFAFVNLIPIQLIQTKVGSYSFYAEEDNTINLFNYLHLSRCMLACLMAWKWKNIMEHNLNGILLVKIYIISLFMFVALSSVPGISSRISELLQIVEIILLPFIIYIFREKGMASIFVVIIGLIFLSASLFYTKLLTGYF